MLRNSIVFFLAILGFAVVLYFLVFMKIWECQPGGERNEHT